MMGLLCALLVTTSTAKLTSSRRRSPTKTPTPAPTTWWPPSELDDDSACVDVVSDTTLSKYRRSIPVPDIYNVSADESVFIPILSSLSIVESDIVKNENVKLAVIYIHGLSAGRHYTCFFLAKEFLY